MKIFQPEYIYQLYEVLTHLNYVDCTQILQLNTRCHKILHNKLVSDLIYDKQQRFVRHIVDTLIKNNQRVHHNLIAKYCKIGNSHIIVELINRGYQAMAPDLLEAIAANRTHIVALLIDIYQVNPFPVAVEAIRMTIIKNYKDIFNKLITDKRVLARIDLQEMFNIACSTNHLEIVDKFIRTINELSLQSSEGVSFNPILNYNEAYEQIYIPLVIKKRLQAEMTMDLSKFKQELRKADHWCDIKRIKSLLGQSDYIQNPSILKLTFKSKKSKVHELMSWSRQNRLTFDLDGSVQQELLAWSMENNLVFVIIELISSFKYDKKTIQGLLAWAKNNETILEEIKCKYGKKYPKMINNFFKKR